MRTIFYLFIALYVTLRPLVPFVDYAVRYDYISQELCVNQSQPQLHCNGKCYLGEELAKSDHHSSQTDLPKVIAMIDAFVAKDILLIQDISGIKTPSLLIDYQPLLYGFQPNFSIFHPPLTSDSI